MIILKIHLDVPMLCGSKSSSIKLAINLKKDDMNKIAIYLLGLLSALIMFSCEDPDPLADIGADLSVSQGNPYVTIAASSDKLLTDTTNQTVTIELPNSIAENVAVNFTIGGSAVAGTDYSVTVPDNVNISGVDGTGEIQFSITEGGADGFDITVVLTDSGVANALGKNITMELVSATAASGRALNLGFNRGSTSVEMVVSDPE